MLILTTLQSLLFVAILLAVVFFCARVITDAERRHMARYTAPQRVSLQHLLGKPEPTAPPRAHLRLVYSGPGLPADVPFDQMKELSL